MMIESVPIIISETYIGKRDGRKMVFEGLISFLPVSTHFLHMKAAERGAMEPAGWHGHSRATTERHIDKITSYEHFSKDFVPHRSVGRYPVSPARVYDPFFIRTCPMTLLPENMAV